MDTPDCTSFGHFSLWATEDCKTDAQANAWSTHLHGFLRQEIGAGRGDGKGAVSHPLYRVAGVRSLHVGRGEGGDFPVHGVCGGVGQL